MDWKQFMETGGMYRGVTTESFSLAWIFRCQSSPINHFRRAQ